jgi:ribosome-associated translation inhibitor RaiA
MRPIDKSHRLRVETDTGNYRLMPDEAAKMDQDLGTLRKVVADFPVAELKVEITVLNPSRVRVGTTLRLPSRTLHAKHDDRFFHPAWDRCVRSLVDQATQYKEQLSNKPTYSKETGGTLHDVAAATPPDAKAIEAAISEGDYRAFRNAMAPYEQSLEARVGRWVKRYPEIESELGAGLTIVQLVEEVRLMAFERYADRPPIRLGEWLEHLIDPAIREILHHMDEEKENLSFIETAKAAEQEAAIHHRKG